MNLIFQDYKLKPNDELYIHISSLDEILQILFSGNHIWLHGYIGMQPYSASLCLIHKYRRIYSITSNWKNLYVKDKTVVELTNIMKDSLSRILKSTFYNCKTS